MDNQFYSKYSVIVPCFNREDEIRELLESFTVLAFDMQRVELIIADDGSTDHTEGLVASYQNRIPFSLNFYTQPNRGPGAARNMGMEKATGDFYIFIDSDCTVPRDWLQQIDSGLRRHRADAFGGRDSSRKDFPAILKAINYSMTSFLTTGGLRGRKGKKLAKFYPRSFNMGFSRKLFQKIGGFGSLRHGQDIEFSHRLIQSGAKVVYLHDAIVFHKRRTSVRKFFRQVFNWGVARINLSRIDSSMLEPLHAAPALAVLVLLILFLLSAVFYPVWQIFRWFLLTGFILLILSALHAAYKEKTWRMLYLVPIIIPVQITGYGTGFILAFIYRIILKKPEWVGFKKKYYS